MKHLTVLLAVVLLWHLPVDGGGQIQARGPEDAFTVVSLNLAMREDVDRIASELLAVGARGADIMFLQEVARRDGEPDVAQQLGARLGLAAVYRDAFALDDGRTVGLATLSRFRWTDTRVIPLERFDLNFRSRTRIALAATLVTPVGHVRTYNLHLDTRINLDQRLAQVAGVVDDIGASTEPVVIGGDFNTNDHRWLFHTIPLPFIGRQARGVERFMTSNGFLSPFHGAGPTHDALGMRLDWVFLRNLHASAASIRPVDMSDHHALVVMLSFSR
jgi:endonuclease/exonuclease/phosphatase family metal-dependent hydrolase